MSRQTSVKFWLARLMRWPGGRFLVRAASTLLAPRHRIGVLLVARDPGGRVLLLRHVFHPKEPWGLPGGWLHSGELPEAGARRELREETGLDASELALLFTSLEIEPRHLVMIFEAKGITGSTKLGFEVLESEFFDVEALPPINPIEQRAIRKSAR